MPAGPGFGLRAHLKILWRRDILITTQAAQTSGGGHVPWSQRLGSIRELQ